MLRRTCFVQSLLVLSDMQPSRGVDENIVAQTKVEMETLFNKLNGLVAAVASASSTSQSASSRSNTRAKAHQTQRLRPRMITLQVVTGSDRSCPTCLHQESTGSICQNFLPARDGQVRAARASVQ